MGAPWVVHEGYLLCRPPDATATAIGTTGSRKLLERYVVLYVNRKVEFFEAAAPETADAERRHAGDALFVGAFAGWDGAGLLKVGEAYGLELRVDPKPHGSGRHTTSLCVAAFNRVDLEKWCRALMAVLDPQSAAGEEVRRERRRVRREEKRLEQEREEKIRKWRELKLKQAEEERERLLAREEEISNMTPLERVDGLGSLDEDTARLLEKRKLRLQRRHAPTTGRVNKAAYRKRMEDGAGGKLENVQPLQPKVVEAKARVRVELPLPGHFFEAADVSSTHRIGLPTARGARGSSGSDSTPSDTSSVSSTSLLSSGNSGSSTSHMRHAGNGHRMSFVPPPPPPPSHAALLQAMQRDSSARSDVAPPPPPPPSRGDTSGFIALDNTRLSRAHSFRGSLYDNDDGDDNDDDDDRRSQVSRASFAQSSRRLSGVDRAKHGVQDNLAAILSGRIPTSGRRDSVASVTSELSAMRVSRSKAKRSGGVASQPPASPEAPATISNAFAASLAAIRRNRADTMDETSGGSPVAKARSRKRESQLSAEGKELLKKAIVGDHSSPARKATTTATAGGRKGLFDDSSSSESDDSDSGLFAGAKKSNGRTGLGAPAKPVNEKPDRHSSTTPTSSHSSAGLRRPSVRGFAPDDDNDDDSDATDASRSEYGGLKSASPSRDSVGISSSKNGTRQLPTVDVVYVSSAVQTEGKKPAGFYTFALRLGAREHQFTHSYNELEAIHLRLAMEFASDALPKFPPKHRLRNNTKPENMQKRALEFVAYFRQLLAVAGVLENQRFRFEFGLPVAGAEAPRGPVNRTAARNPDRSRAPVSPVANARTSQRPPAATKASTQLFATDGGSGSEDDSSDSDASAAPSSRMPPSRSRASTAADAPPPRDEPRARKATKQPSSKAFAVEFEPLASSSSSSRTSRRPSSTASRAAASESPVPVAAPKITGLPSRPNLFGGGRGDLLAAIRNGAELRKTDEAAAPSSSSKAPLLAPKSNGSSSGAAAAAAPAGSINDAITNAMAARRIHVEFEEAHSDEDNDSDDDWD
ncbi:hypothetical protein PybrP1_013054 [[Pythium] brassicae (nom. inval.)]|nr:hypothetical protein PybrP1_013054 [[Pythium] brassicae (nom. inval.)]